MPAHNHVTMQEVLGQVGDRREPDGVAGLQRVTGCYWETNKQNTAHFPGPSNQVMGKP